MPTQARCDRVPPPHVKWDALDLRVLQEDDLPLGKNNIRDLDLQITSDLN